jgi:threonine/homoserine/homoserine lactone efflux protein
MLAAGLGLAYLIWLGVRMIRLAKVSGQDSSTGKAHITLRSLWLQGFVTSASNSKAIVFFAALFPQFIQSGNPFWPQFLTLSATYIIVDGLFLSGYGAGSSWIASRLKREARPWIERVGGGFMTGAAILLALKTSKGTL